MILALALVASFVSAAVRPLPEISIAGDETPVNEAFFAVTDPAALAARKPALAAIVGCAKWHLAESVRLSKYNGGELSEAVCGNAAPKLGLMLRWAGLPVDVIDNYNHVYLASRGEGGVLIIDPTIRQFFGQRKAPQEIPEIFIGTYEELVALYVRHAEAITWQPGFESIYFDSSRTQNMVMSYRRRQILSEPTSRENAAIWRFATACLP